MEKFPPPPSIGIDYIDKQHNELVEVINLLVDDKITNTTQLALLSKLEKLLLTHFPDEVEFMQKSKFPFMGTHLVEHSLLIARFTEIFDAASKNQLTNDLLTTLATDINDHIEHYDVLYANYNSAMNKDVSQI